MDNDLAYLGTGDGGGFIWEIWGPILFVALMMAAVALVVKSGWGKVIGGLLVLFTGLQIAYFTFVDFILPAIQSVTAHF